MSRSRISHRSVNETHKWIKEKDGPLYLFVLFPTPTDIEGSFHSRLHHLVTSTLRKLGGGTLNYFTWRHSKYPLSQSNSVDSPGLWGPGCALLSLCKSYFIVTYCDHARKTKRREKCTSFTGIMFMIASEIRHFYQYKANLGLCNFCSENWQLHSLSIINLFSDKDWHSC